MEGSSSTTRTRGLRVSGTANGAKRGLWRRTPARPGTDPGLIETELSRKLVGCANELAPSRPQLITASLLFRLQRGAGVVENLPHHSEAPIRRERAADVAAKLIFSMQNNFAQGQEQGICTCSALR